MSTNQKYVTAENIMARLAMTHKKKSFTIDEIVEWCAECTIEILGNPVAMYDYNRFKVIVTGNLGLLPCNMYRLLDVYDASNTRIKNYYNDGVHLIFNTTQTFYKDDLDRDYVYINYSGVPVDNKTGYPLILKGHELACEAYCTWKLYYEDFLSNNINGQQWQYIDQQKIIQCSAGNNGVRHETNDDSRRMLNVVLNMIPNMNNIPLYHLNEIE
jgi:hypothetical protein